MKVEIDSWNDNIEGNLEEFCLSSEDGKIVIGGRVDFIKNVHMEDLFQILGRRIKYLKSLLETL